MDLDARKPVFEGLRTTRAQTSLRISAVWSAPLLFTYWKVPYLDLLRAKFQFSSRSQYLSDLVWISLCRKPHKQVLSQHGPYNMGHATYHICVKMFFINMHVTLYIYSMKLGLFNPFCTEYLYDRCFGIQWRPSWNVVFHLGLHCISKIKPTKTIFRDRLTHSINFDLWHLKIQIGQSYTNSNCTNMQDFN